ncbi:MAG: hypothetical protein FWD22_04870 [Treponema sp.]|nr:hypothetical protein [Treponema sp.]
MSIFKSIIATTHVDSARRRITKNEIEHLVEAYNTQYIRMTDEHDPRKIVIGRTIACKLLKLDDGEYAAEATYELFDGKDPVKDDDNKYLVIENANQNENISIYLDDSYNVKDKFEKVKELKSLIKKSNDLSLNIKNSIEPLSVLIIAGTFVFGKIFEGFFHKIGDDIYEKFKDKLFEVLETQKHREEHVLQFSLNLKKEKEEYRANIFITNPKKEDIETVLKYGLKKLDSELGMYLTPEIKEINIEFNNKKFEVIYYLDGKAKPYIPDEKFKMIDILV